MASVLQYFRKMFGEKGSADVARRFLFAPDPTPDYHKRWFDASEALIEELPLFTLWTARMMRRDPVVRIGLQARNAALSAGEVLVESDNAEVVEYVERLHKVMWGHHGMIVRRTKHYGFNAFQVEYTPGDDGYLYPLHLINYSPHDVRALIYRESPVGFIVRHGYGSTSGAAEPLLPPKGCWLTYNTEDNQFYGESILRHSYGPWYEKWMKRGAKRVTQMRFMKDAYVGDAIWYPPNRTVTTTDGTVHSWRDIMREVGENRMSGNPIYLPNFHDDQGNKLVDYEPPKDTGNPTGIMQWMDSLNIDIWRGMDVFEEVIRASTTGSGFSGRSVPFLMFLSSCNDEHTELVNGLNQFIYTPLVWLQFGSDVRFTVKPIPLAETFVSDIAGSSIGGQSMGGSHGDRDFPDPEGDEKEQSYGKGKNGKNGKDDAKAGGMKRSGMWPKRRPAGHLR